MARLVPPDFARLTPIDRQIFAARTSLGAHANYLFEDIADMTQARRDMQGGGCVLNTVRREHASRAKELGRQP